MGDCAYIWGSLFGILVFLALHRPIIRMCEWIVGIKPLEDPFKNKDNENKPTPSTKPTIGCRNRNKATAIPKLGIFKGKKKYKKNIKW